ncbi:unnamed protein product [Phytomonas sp. EM1]|nr:unnamed protein product [Phytomonas sp. EM1]|eukprot:CCW59525.1 unnamed protein product [Phytomonas sp. isolate EM1]
MWLTNRKRGLSHSGAVTYKPLTMPSKTLKRVSESLDLVQNVNIPEVDEESIQRSVKLHERRRKQLVSREEKARQSLVSEERMGYADVVASEKFSRESMQFFLHFRDTAIEEQEARWRRQKEWMEYRLREQTRSTLEEEVEMRQKIVRLEASLWQTIAHLHHIESKPLLLAMRLAHLVDAERMRRGYLMNVEVAEALAMDIPHYTPVLMSTHVRGPVGKKIDYLENERCPFVCLEECPYYPKKLAPSRTARKPSDKANVGLSNDDDDNIRFLRYSTLQKGHYKHHYS